MKIEIERWHATKALGRTKIFVATVALFCVTSPAVADDYSFTTLDFPGANHTYVEGINNQGQIVGGYTGSQIQGFIYSGGTYTPLE